MFDKYSPTDLVWVHIPDELVKEGQVSSRRVKSADGEPIYRVEVEGEGSLFVHEMILKPRRLGEPRPKPRRGWWRVFPD